MTWVTIGAVKRDLIKDIKELALNEEEKGATVVEYGLILALILVVCIVAVTSVGEGANDALSNVGSSITG